MDSYEIGNLFVTCVEDRTHYSGIVGNGDRPCENTTDKRPVSDADGDLHPASTIVSESGPSIKV